MIHNFIDGVSILFREIRSERPSLVNSITLLSRVFRIFWRYSVPLAVIGVFFLTARNTKMLEISGKNLGGLISISSEVSTESGPSIDDYRKAVQGYQDLLHNLIKELKHQSSLNTCLAEQLDRIRSDFEKPFNNEAEAKELVRRAAAKLNGLVSNLDASLGEEQSTLLMAQRPAPSPEMFGLSILAFKDFHQAVTNLNNIDTLPLSEAIERIKAVCLASRYAGAYLQIAWLAYQTPESLVSVHRFANDLGISQSVTARFRSRSPDPLDKYLKSMERRIFAVTALTNSSFGELRSKLLQASSDYPRNDTVIQ